MTPFRYAMSLVNSDHADLCAADHFNEAFVVETLGRDVPTFNCFNIHFQLDLISLH